VNLVGFIIRIWRFISVDYLSISLIVPLLLDLLDLLLLL